MIEAKIQIADGSEIAYKFIKNGDKPVIIFVNGSIFNYHQFNYTLYPQLHKKLKDNYSYLFYDYVGIGASSPLQGDFDFVKITEQHFEFMDAVGIEKAHHFGFSKGSLISLFAASSRPERVLSVGSYGSPNLDHDNVITRKEMSLRLQYLNSITGLWQQPVDDKNFKLVYDTVYLPIIFKGQQASSLGLIGKLRSWWVKNKLKPISRGTLIHNMVKLYGMYKEEITDEDREKYLSAMKSVQTPVILLHSVEDETVPFAGAEALCKLLPNCKFISYEDYGHASVVLLKKQGKQVMKDYSEFLNSL